MTDQELTQIHSAVNAAFRKPYELTREKGESVDAWEARFNAANIAAAREVYDLTRELSLHRQTFAEAPAYKPKPGIPLNAFARRREAGLLGEGLRGYPFDTYARARVAMQTLKAEKAASRTRKRAA